MKRLNSMCLSIAFYILDVIYLPTTAELQIYDLCPYTTFCSRGPKYNLSDPNLQSCCLPCSCHDDCVLIGNCCPDKEGVNVSTPRYPCRTQTDIYSRYLNVSLWGTHSEVHYRVIDGCPLSAWSNQGLNKSIARCHSAEGADDLRFVTGNQSGHTYLNQHCALCNGESAFSEWGIYLVSSEMMAELMSFEDMDRYILNTGNVIAVAPTNEIALSALCSGSRPPKHGCNLSDLQNVRDEEIEEKCGLYQITFFDEIRFYSNVYCFICRSPKHYPVPETCEKIQTNSLSEKAVLGLPFSALILNKPVNEKTAENSLQEHPCPPEETMDPLLMKCTELLCPIGTAVLGSTCQQLMDTIVGISIYVAVQVVFGNDTDPNTVDTDLLLTDLRSHFLSSINTGQTRCDLCSQTVVKTKDGIISSILIGSTDSCSHIQIIRGMSGIIKANITDQYLRKVKLNVTFVDLEGTLTYTDLWNMDMTENYYKTCTNGLDFSRDAVYCPSVMIDINDITAVTNNSRLHEDVSYYSTQLRNGKLRICLEDYKRIVNISSETAAMFSFQLNVELIFYCVTVYFITTPN